MKLEGYFWIFARDRIAQAKSKVNAGFAGGSEVGGRREVGGQKRAESRGLNVWVGVGVPNYMGARSEKNGKQKVEVEVWAVGVGTFSISKEQ